VTIDEYIARTSAMQDRIVLFTGGTSQTDGRERLLLLLCEERKIPVFKIDDDDTHELLRKVCIKANVQRASLASAAAILRLEDVDAPAALDIVRRNFERFIGVKTTVASFEPSELPLLIRMRKSF
jgi:hypothetical protein